MIILISIFLNPCLFFALVVGMIFFGTIIDKMIPKLNDDNIKLEDTIKEKLEDLSIILSLSIFAIIVTFNWFNFIFVTS